MSDFEEFFPIIKCEVFQRNNKKIEEKRVRILDIMINENSQLVTPKNLPYFVQPKSFPLDLNLGYEDYKLRSEEYYDFNLRKLEKYLMEHNGRSLLKNKEKQQICTSRNVLKLIMTTPYSRYDWDIKVIKFGDVIYLTKDREVQRAKNRGQTFHYKLQQNCFADSPHDSPDTDKPIDEDHQLSCVFEAAFDNFEILYAAEVAGVESDCPIMDIKNPHVLNNSKFVTTKLLNRKFASNWKTHYKLLEWWTQAHMGNVEKIYIGFNSNDGFVNRPLESINVKDLPKNQKWNPEICKRFLCEFLKKIKATMHDVNTPYTTFEFKLDRKMQMIFYRIFEDKKEELFLTEQFIQYMQM